jgi:hypothetical protein
MPESGFTIDVWVPPKYENGLRIVGKTNWDGEIAICERAATKDALAHELKDRVGAYILIGVDEADSPTIYIGEGDPIQPRIQEHIGKKEFWTYFVALLRRGAGLNKTQIQYIESSLIKLADSAKRCKLDNVNRPGQPTISTPMRADIEYYIEQAVSVLQTFGLYFFTQTTANVTKFETQQIVEYVVKGVTAKGYVIVEGFVVLKGSGASGIKAPSITPGNDSLRQQLIDGNVLISTGSDYQFAPDQSFSSPSTASAVVGANNTSGWRMWRDPITGKNLLELEQIT